MIAFFAAAAPATCDHSFFFFPNWWEFLAIQPDPAKQCAVYFHFPDNILPVSLAIVDMLLRVAGLVAIFAVIAAGVGYITAGGDVQKTATSKKRIYNALAGLAIVTVASGLVAFIGNSLGG